MAKTYLGFSPTFIHQGINKNIWVIEELLEVIKNMILAKKSWYESECVEYSSNIFIKLIEAEKDSKRLDILVNAIYDWNETTKWFWWSIKKFKETDINRWRHVEITPAQVQDWIVFLDEIEVPSQYWTPYFYEETMSNLFNAMTCGEDKYSNIIITGKRFSITQAEAIIRLFSSFLDTNDVRLNVPDGHGFLTSDCTSCEKCYKTLLSEDIYKCKKRKCFFSEDD